MSDRIDTINDIVKFFVGVIVGLIGTLLLLQLETANYTHKDNLLNKIPIRHVDVYVVYSATQIRPVRKN